MNLESFPNSEEDAPEDGSFLYEENIPDQDKESRRERLETVAELERFVNERERKAQKQAQEKFFGKTDAPEGSEESSETPEGADSARVSQEELEKQLETLGISSSTEESSDKASELERLSTEELKRLQEQLKEAGVQIENEEDEEAS